GRTTITIAHRLSTIRDAHCIFVMGDGLVLEQGTHDELLHKPDGHYSRLVQDQALREKQDNINDSSSDIGEKVVGDVDEPIPQPKSPEPLRRASTIRSITSGA